MSAILRASFLLHILFTVDSLVSQSTVKFPSQITVPVTPLESDSISLLMYFLIYTYEFSTGYIFSPASCVVRVECRGGWSGYESFSDICLEFFLFWASFSRK